MPTEIQKLLDDNAALPLWPETGKALILECRAPRPTPQPQLRARSRQLRLGRLMRVPTSWLKAQLGLTESRPAA